MIVMIDLHNGCHYETRVEFHNGKPITLTDLIDNMSIFRTIKVTSGGEDLQIPLEEIKRIGFSTDAADGIRQ